MPLATGTRSETRPDSVLKAFVSISLWKWNCSVPNEPFGDRRRDDQVIVEELAARLEADRGAGRIARAASA